MPKQVGKKKGGARKIGRNETKCKAYRASKKRERAHIRALQKHLKRQPQDRAAHDALDHWKEELRLR